MSGCLLEGVNRLIWMWVQTGRRVGCLDGMKPLPWRQTNINKYTGWGKRDIHRIGMARGFQQYATWLSPKVRKKAHKIQDGADWSMRECDWYLTSLEKWTGWNGIKWMIAYNKLLSGNLSKFLSFVFVCNLAVYFQCIYFLGQGGMQTGT